MYSTKESIHSVRFSFTNLTAISHSANVSSEKSFASAKKRLHISSEAARLGFKRIIISGYAPKQQKNIEGIEVVRIHSVSELGRHIFNKEIEEES